jgi:hypothetical protein
MRWRVENVCFLGTWDIPCYGVDAFYVPDKPT